MDRNYRGAFAGILGVALALGGCASTDEEPDADQSVVTAPRPHASAQAASKPGAGTYRVQRGDTLYSIAFRHGLDYREVAEWNRIAPPYTIYPGRALRLSPVRESPKREAAAAPASASSAPSVQSSRSASSTPGPFEPVAGASAPSASGTSALPTPATSPKPAAPSLSDATPASSGDVAWHWPADGQVVGTFTAGDPVRQGIDIAGDPGAPVRAAADGTVVYSGNGLIGYGELIIVKHNPAFLSAYGHNRKRLVQEGDRVKAGQTIAEMGASGASRNELHFEIRRNGKPSNPLDYLPRR